MGARACARGEWVGESETVVPLLAAQKAPHTPPLHGTCSKGTKGAESTGLDRGGVGLS